MLERTTQLLGARSGFGVRVWGPGQGPRRQSSSCPSVWEPDGNRVALLHLPQMQTTLLTLLWVEEGPTSWDRPSSPAGSVDLPAEVHLKQPSSFHTRRP